MANIAPHAIAGNLRISSGGKKIHKSLFENLRSWTKWLNQGLFELTSLQPRRWVHAQSPTRQSGSSQFLRAHLASLWKFLVQIGQVFNRACPTRICTEKTDRNSQQTQPSPLLEFRMLKRMTYSTIHPSRDWFIKVVWEAWNSRKTSRKSIREGPWKAILPSIRPHTLDSDPISWSIKLKKVMRWPKKIITA